MATANSMLRGGLYNICLDFVLLLLGVIWDYMGIPVFKASLGMTYAHAPPLQGGWLLWVPSGVFGILLCIAITGWIMLFYHAAVKVNYPYGNM